MTASVSKNCSRCKMAIECHRNSIEQCACSKIVLTAECIELLKLTSYNCLCNNCLKSIDKLVQQAEHAPMKMTENIHYYLEDGMLVFTELNHIQRGYCCQSNCRHCAYGFGG